MRAICAVASTGHKDTHTRTHTHICQWWYYCLWVCVRVCHTLLCTVCVWIIIVHVSVWVIIYERPCMWACLCVCFCVCVCVCVPTATVGCGGWNVCFSAGPVRPLLLNICPQHINSPTLTHPSLPRDHLIEIHNDSFFSSSPTLSKVRLGNVFLEKRGIFLSTVIKSFITSYLVCFFFVCFFSDSWHTLKAPYEILIWWNISLVDQINVLKLFHFVAC